MAKLNSPVTTLKQEVLSGMEFLLRTYDFRKREQQFEKGIQEFNQIVHLGFLDNRAEQRVSVVLNFGVRHNRIEEIVHSWRTDLSEREKRSTATVGTEYGRLIEGRQILWHVGSTEDAKLAIGQIFDAVLKRGLSYLEQYSNLGQIAAMLGSKNPRDWQGQLAGGRALRLPLAYVFLGDRERACREFVQQYGYLKSLDDLLVKDYPGYVAHVCREFNLDNPLEKTDGEI